MSVKILDHVQAGVVTGEDVQTIFSIAKENNFALPAVNVVGTNSMNAVLEAARQAQAPVIIQFSNGGASFNAAKAFLMMGSAPLFSGRFPVLSMFICWLRNMVYPLFCTRITRLKNCSPG